MYEAHTFTLEEEQQLLADWFETVHWDEESEGIPELDPERDDEGRSYLAIDAIPMDDLMAELRKRDPENPF